MKPNFESPVHTARDLVERDITLYMVPGTGGGLLAQSDIPEYRKIEENAISLKSVHQYTAFTKNEMLSRGTHAVMVSYWFLEALTWVTELDHDRQYKYNHGRGYYRGEKLVGDNPSSGYLTNKMWHLNEVFYNIE